MQTKGKNNIVLISTFVIFVTEAVLTFMIGKRSSNPDAEWSMDLLPTFSDMIHIFMVVGTFSFINQQVVKSFQ